GLRRCLYTRIAAAIAAHLRSPELSLDQLAFSELCTRKRVLESAFELSGFGDAGHLVESFGRRGPDGNVDLPMQALPIACLFFSLDQIPTAMLSAALTLSPAILAPLLLGWISNTRVLTATGEMHRAMLLRAHERIAGQEIAVPLRLALAKAWMHCSYADIPDKHEIKRSFNSLWQRVIEAEGIRARATNRPGAKRPRLLVCAERLKSDHAMFRVYGAAIEQLRSRFELVLLAEQNDQDAGAAALFDRTESFDLRSSTLKDIVARVIRLEPDLIFYPSLGMSDWTEVLANQRLARIQFMSFGHPATSMSPCIDYALLSGLQSEASAAFCSEIVVLRTGHDAHAPHPELPDAMPVLAPPADGALHIAVNSNVMKLSHRLLAVCQGLIREAGVPVHLNFFPFEFGVGFDHMRHALEVMFERVTVHPVMHYRDFLAAMSHCEMALAAFPFGNTNSTVDTSLMGIPVVAYTSEEPLSLGDKSIMRRLPVPPWLLATDDESYFRAALRLAREPGLRSSISKALREPSVRADLFRAEDTQSPTEFVDAVWWINANDAAIRASGRRCLRVGEALP
ncbi:MAG: hypothetical protein ACKPE6_11260, partial [Gammaproteobacteria bacterium]